MSHNAYKFETETSPAGKIEPTVPVPPGTRVEVLVMVPTGDECSDLVAAAASSTDFLDNPLDDEDWNNAQPARYSSCTRLVSVM